LLKSPAGYSGSAVLGASAGTIINDDTDVTVSVSPGSVAEDGSINLVYTFTRTPLTSGDLVVNFSTVGAADHATDYVVSGTGVTYNGGTNTGTVTIGAGQTTATVTIDPTADSTVESDEDVVLTVTSGAGYNVVSPSSATGTIENDDTAVTISVSPSSVAEDGSTNLTFTFTRTGVTTNDLAVSFSTSGAAEDANDHTVSGTGVTYNAGTNEGTVTIPSGQSSATVTVDPRADTAVESDEDVTLTVTSGTLYSAGSPTSATGSITNDDAAPGSVASFPFIEDWESGSLADYWEVILGTEGRVQVTSDWDPYQGSYHVTLDDHTGTGGDHSTNQLILHIDLTGESGVYLTFYNKEWEDENDTEDSIDVSVDGGSTWYQVTPLHDDDSTGAYTGRAYYLDSLALTYSAETLIRFQQHDNWIQ